MFKHEPQENLEILARQMFAKPKLAKEKACENQNENKENLRCKT